MDSATRCGRYGLLTLLTLAAAACANPVVAATRCDRDCLRDILQRYLEAVVHHDVSAAPLASTVRITENAVVVPTGEGIWKTATGLGSLQRRFADPHSQQAAYFGTLQEGPDTDIVSVRVKVAHGHISEAEWTLARKAYGGMFSPEGLEAMPPPSDSPIPRSERAPRAQMIAAANAYFEGLQIHDGSAIPHINGCERVENGFRVTHRVIKPRPAGADAAAGAPPGATPTEGQEFRSGDCAAGLQMFANSIAATTQRRFPVVDEAAGVVMGSTLFHRPPTSSMKRNLLTEFFFERGGKIAGIYAAMFYLDPSAPDSPGWPADGPDPMAAFYGNTLHETRANGTQSWFHFNADHSFTADNSNGTTAHGEWRLNDRGETCIVMGKQAPAARPACVALHAQKIGDQWDREGPHGNEHYVLETGRSEAASAR